MYYMMRVRIPITVDVMVSSESEEEVLAEIQLEVESGIDFAMPGVEYTGIDWQIESDDCQVHKLAEWESMVE